MPSFLLHALYNTLNDFANILYKFLTLYYHHSLYLAPSLLYIFSLSITINSVLKYTDLHTQIQTFDAGSLIMIRLFCGKVAESGS